MNNPIQPDDERLGLISASTAARTWACPGWLQLAKECPPEPPRQVTEEGQRIHKALENGDDGGLKETEAEIKQRLDKQSAASIAKWREDYGIPDGPYQTLREERLYIRDSQLRILASAKVDHLEMFGEYAFDEDYKTGFKKTESADTNKQLLIHVLAIVSEFPQVRFVRAAINASRLKSYFDCVDYGPEDIANARKSFLFAEWSSRQPDAPRHPGPHCFYCPCKGGYCPEALAFSNLDLMTFKQPIADGKLMKADVELRIAQAPIEAVAKIQKKAGVIAEILDACKRRLSGLPEPELNALGLRHKPTGSTRNITDEAKAKEALLRILPAKTVDDLFHLSLGQTETAIKLAFALTQKDAKAKVNEILEPWINRVPKADTIDTL